MVCVTGGTNMFREGLERTTKELAASAPSAMKIKVAAPPDLGAMTLPLRGSVVPAARCLISTCGYLASCFIRSLESYPAHSMKIWWLRQGCIGPQF